MKKFLLILPLLLNVPHSHAIIEKRIAQGGAVLGAIIGSALGYGLAKVTEEDIYGETVYGTHYRLKAVGPTEEEIKYHEEKQEKREPKAAVLGGALGGFAGWIAGKKAEKIMLQRYARKHKVNKQIARASWNANITINDETRPLFIEAQNKNKQFLHDFISEYYTNIFGTNWLVEVFGERWQTITPSLALQALSYRTMAKLRLFLSRGTQGWRFMRSINLPYALATLYFDEKFPEKGGSGSFQDKVKIVRKLINTLFPK